MNWLFQTVLCLFLVLYSTRAFADDFSITLLQPGAGFLVAGEESQIPLELLVRKTQKKQKLKRAKVRASLGRATNTRIVSNNRVVFLYTPPSSSRRTEETLEVELTFSGGNTMSQALGFKLDVPHAPNLTLAISDTSIDASRPKRINLSASAVSQDVKDLKVFSSHGELSFPGYVQGSPNELFAGASLIPPLNMPSTEPSHFIVLAVASGKRGFSAQVSGVSTYAQVQFKAEIPRGSRFILEGTRNNPPPVTAPADGFTSSSGIIEYGKPIRAYRIRGRRRREVPITVPTGIVPDGLAVAIPGQDIADGGTGPTVLVAIPPSPFGDEPYWPEIEIEGIENSKLKVLEVAERIRAFIFQRPSRPQNYTVLADRAPIGTIEFKSSHAAKLKVESSFAEKSERGAIIAKVFDPLGGKSDHPAPIARIEDGPDLPVQRIEAGQYRIVVPSNIPGETGEKITIITELPSLNIVHGDPPELVQRNIDLKLEGPPPAIRANLSDPSPIGKTSQKPVTQYRPLGLKLDASFGSGFLFAPIVNFGARVCLGGALPILDQKLSVIGGLEIARSVNEGLISFGRDQTLSVDNQIYSLSLPLEFEYLYLRTGPISLLAAAGGELRFDTTTIDQDTTRISARKTTQVAGRIRMGFIYDLSEVLGLTFSTGLRGIGATAEKASSASFAVTGSLMQAFATIGFQLSF